MIDIDSDAGTVGNFHWVNTNQDFYFEIGPGRHETLPCTIPAWWGVAWFGEAPKRLVRRFELVIRMLSDEST